MAEPMRVELVGGELAGRYVLVERKQLNGGFMEDMQSGDMKLILNALSRAIVGGDLPGFGAADLMDGDAPAVRRLALRELGIEELTQVTEAVAGCLKVPKR